MSDVYSVVEGRFGSVEVREIHHNLIVHAREHMQFGFWMGGGTAHAHVGAGQGRYSDTFSMGINRYQSHDFVLDDPDKPAIILYLYIHLPYLDDVCSDLGNPVFLLQPQIFQTPEMRLAAWQLMQRVIALKDASFQKIEPEVIGLLRLTIKQAASQMLPDVWPQRRKLLDYRLRLALSFMKDNSASNTSIGDVASRVGLSRSRLYELFQCELDSTPQIVWNSMLTKHAIRNVRGTQDDLTNGNYEITAENWTGGSLQGLSATSNLAVDLVAPAPPVITSSAVVNDATPVITGTA